MHNGDKIEILTTKTKPKSKIGYLLWLHQGSTTIKYLKDLEYKKSKQVKKLLSENLLKNKVKFGDDNVHKLLKFYGVKSALDLYVAASQNKLDISLLKDF